MSGSMRARLLILGVFAGFACSEGTIGDTLDKPVAAPLVFESVARRLSLVELDRTITALLGDTTSPAARFLTPDLFTPYDNDYLQQQPSRALIEALDQMAEDVAKRALADHRDSIVGCTPTGPGDAVCMRDFIARFGKRALRRPLGEDEIDAYAALQSYATESVPGVANDFYTGVELVIRAMLQDPEMLYRVEVGVPTDKARVNQLGDHEIVTRLVGVPTDKARVNQLLAIADRGGLANAETRRSVASGMLADPRARAQVQRFHAMWLGYRAIPHPQTLAQAFGRETSALINDVVFDNARDYRELFTSPRTFIDATLAANYSMSLPGGAPGWVDYGAGGRAGILSHGSVLSTFGKFSDTSPTQRGIFVRTRLFCEEVAPPPPDANVDAPPSSPDGSPCKVDRYAKHRESSSCAACHGRLDPIGFGLENYDMAGRYRTHDDGLDACTIDGRGEITGIGSFQGPKELAELLVSSHTLDACVTQQMYSFAIGRPLTGDELPQIERATRRFAENGYDFRGLLLDFVGDDLFAQKREPAQ